MWVYILVGVVLASVGYFIYRQSKRMDRLEEDCFLTPEEKQFIKEYNDEMSKRNN